MKDGSIDGVSAEGGCGKFDCGDLDVADNDDPRADRTPTSSRREIP